MSWVPLLACGFAIVPKVQGGNCPDAQMRAGFHLRMGGGVEPPPSQPGGEEGLLGASVGVFRA